MSVHVYGINHIAIEVDDIEKAVAFYEDVFGLEKLDEGEGDAFFKLGEHQFLAIFEVDEVRPDRVRHFGLMVRDEAQIAEVRQKLTSKYSELRSGRDFVATSETRGAITSRSSTCTTSPSFGYSLTRRFKRPGSRSRPHPDPEVKRPGRRIVVPLSV